MDRPMKFYEGVPKNRIGINIRENFKDKIEAEKHTVKDLIENVTMPLVVRQNKYSRAKWEEIVSSFKSWDISHIVSIDSGLFQQYCILWANYSDLLDFKKKILKGVKDPVTILGLLNKTRIESQIDSKIELMLKLGKQLYLDPVSRMSFLHKNAKTIVDLLNKEKNEKNGLDENRINVMFGN